MIALGIVIGLNIVVGLLFCAWLYIRKKSVDWLIAMLKEWVY